MSVQKLAKSIPLLKDVCLKCQHCDACFGSLSEMENHLGSAHPELCPICGLNFSSDGKEEHHKSYHSDTLLKCPLCQGSFLEQVGFLDHAKTCHKLCQEQKTGKKPMISILPVTASRQGSDPSTSEPARVKEVHKSVVIQKVRKTENRENAKVEKATLIHKKAISVEDDQISIPKLSQEVIVMDVSELRGNVGSFIKLLPPTQPTIKSVSSSTNPPTEFQGHLSNNPICKKQNEKKPVISILPVTASCLSSDRSTSEPACEKEVRNSLEVQKVKKTKHGENAKVDKTTSTPKNAISVENKGLEKKMNRIGKPVQTSTPKLFQEVIVLDVSDLKGNVGSFKKTLPPTQTTMKYVSCSTKPLTDSPGHLSKKPNPICKEQKTEKKPVISILPVTASCQSSDRSTSEPACEKEVRKSLEIQKVRKAENRENAKVEKTTSTPKNAISVGNKGLEKKMNRIGKPVQTSTPKLSQEVIVMDVSELRGNVGSFIKPLPPTQPTIKYVSKPLTESKGHLNQKPYPISPSKPTGSSKNTSSKTQAESKKNVIEVGNLEFMKVIKDFIPTPAELPAIPAVRRSLRTKRKLTPDGTVLPSRLPKRLKRINKKSPITTPRKRDKSKNCADLVKIPPSRVPWSKPCPKSCNSSISLSEKAFITKVEDVRNKLKHLNPAILKKMVQLKTARVVLQRLPNNIVKQCLRDGFIGVKPLRNGVQNQVKQEIFCNRSRQGVFLNWVFPSLLSSFPRQTANKNVKNVQTSLPKAPTIIVLPKASATFSTPRKLEELPPKAQPTFQTDNQNVKAETSLPKAPTIIIPPKESAAFSSPRKLEELPSKDSGLAPTIVQWMVEMEEKRLKTPLTPPKAQSTCQKAEPSNFSKPAVTHQNVQLNQKSVEQPFDSWTITKSSGINEPSTVTADVTLVCDTKGIVRGKLVKITSDNETVSQCKLTSFKTEKPPKTVKTYKRNVVPLSSNSSTLIESPVADTVEKESFKPSVASQADTSSREKEVPVPSTSGIIKSPLMEILSDRNSLEKSPTHSSQSDATKKGSKELFSAVFGTPMSGIVKRTKKKVVKRTKKKVVKNNKRKITFKNSTNRKKVSQTSTSGVKKCPPLVILLSDDESLEETLTPSSQSEATEKTSEGFCSAVFGIPLVRKVMNEQNSKQDVISEKSIGKEKEALKREKLALKKTSKFVEKKLELLQELQTRVLRPQCHLSASQEKLLKDIANLLSSFNKHQAKRVFLQYGFNALLRHLEKKCLIPILTDSPEVLKKSFIGNSASIHNLTRVDDPIDMNLITLDK